MDEKNTTDITKKKTVALEEGAGKFENENRLQPMVEASVFYGRSKSRTNPKMKPYISATRSGVEVINLASTIEMLDNAIAEMARVVKKGGLLLMVGTTPATKFSVREVADHLDVPYVTERWLGGTLTNFETISKRVKRLKKLKEDKESGALGKYTKKERLGFEREMEKLDRLFGGIEKLDRIPDLIFVADLDENKIAATEGRKAGVTSVALVNTSSNPDETDFPIPANNRSPKSVELIMKAIEDGIAEAKKAAVLEKEEKEKEKESEEK